MTIGCDSVGSNDIPDPGTYPVSTSEIDPGRAGIIVPNVLKNVKAVSISYAGTSCTEGGGLAHYIAHAVDKEGNPVSGVTFNASLINGIKVIKNRNLGGGILVPATQAGFADSDINFVDAGVTDEDRLIIIPNSSNFNQDYLGNWTIDQVSEHMLILKEAFVGSNISPLSYIIGNEKRYLEGIGVAVADIKRSSTFDTNITGEVPFDIVFDRVLSGHTFTIALDVYFKDSDGVQRRVGIAKVESFRGSGYASSQESIKIDGEDHIINLTLSIADCGGQPVEPLVGVDIVPDSIIFSSTSCSLNLNDSRTNLTTDSNGQITIVVSTDPATTDSGDCDVSWESSNRGIYMEY